MNTDFRTRLGEAAGIENILEREPMKRHTTFKIGGPCDYFVKIISTEKLNAVMKLAKEYEVPFHIIGRGSNLLVDDDGVKGIVAVLTGKLEEVSRSGNRITAGAGAAIAKVAVFAATEGLSGLEFAGGIPGSVGGGLAMNAGAYGGEMKDVVLEAAILCDGQVRYLKNEDLNLSYRHSILDTMKDAVVLSVTFELKEGDPVAIQDKINELNARRREKQPLEYPSAGSTFKRPVGGYASALIESAGLKGISVGGAAVSDKHAGFIINKDDASFHDVKALIKLVQETVEIESGILLEPEVKIIEQ